MLRLLQTLDTDEDPSNGITLPTRMVGDISLGVDFDAQVQGFLDQNSVQNALVTATAANNHFQQTGNNTTPTEGTVGEQPPTQTPPSTGTPTPSHPELIGTWTFDFYGYTTYQLDYTDTMLTETVTGAGGSLSISTYSYAITGNTTLSSGETLQKIELQLLSSTARYTGQENQALIDGLNQANYMGFSDWRLNETKDLTAYYIAINHNVRKELISVQGNTMTFTMERQPSYPSNLDAASTYTRSN